MSSDEQSTLEIRLLGDFELRSDEQPVPAIDKGRLQSFLAYLVLHSGKPQKRSSLAFVFWPDSEEKQALTNLRNLLHGLRQALPQADCYLRADGRAITWLADSPYRLDVEKFEAALLSADRAFEASDYEAASAELSKANQLYQGDLLSKLYDEWIEPERERLRLSISKALAQLVDVQKRQGEFEAALFTAKQLLQRDPLSEASHYTLIELLALQGDRAAALKAYENCRDTLHNELDIEPGKTLQTLHQQIANDEVQPIQRRKSVLRPRAPRENRPTDTGAEPSPLARSELKRPALLAVCLASLILLFAWQAFQRQRQPTLDKSIAVLPFDNRSALEEDASLSDGVHDDLITQLSRIRDIKTISRTSVMRYRDSEKTLRAISDELGVATLLQGSVQRSGERIRINVQLIDARTDFNLWARSYTRDLTASDIFAIQSAIVADVANSLEVVLTTEEEQRIDFVPTTNIVALEAYYQGKRLSAALRNEAFDQAVERFQYAIEQDPGFANAYAALAHVYLNQIYYRGMTREEQIRRAEPLIKRALEINPELGEAYSALGTLRRYADDWTGAIDAYKRAVELSPHDAQTYYQYGNVVEWQLRRPEEALALKRKAVELDPENYGNGLILNSSLSALGRFDEARAILESVLQDDPDNAYACFDLGRLLGNAYYKLDESVFWLRKGFARDPQNPNFAREIALCYEYLSDYEEAARWLQRSIDLAPTGTDSEIFRGQIAIYLGNYEEAYAIFRQAPRNSDYYPWALYYLSVNDLEEGRYAETITRILAAQPALVDTPNQDVDETNFWMASLLAYAYKQLAQTDKADKLIRRSLALYDTMPRMGINQGGYSFNDVCVLATKGDTRTALSRLREAVDQGYYPNTLFERPELKALRDEPEFQSILAEIEAQLARQLANLREMEERGDLAPIPQAITP